MEFWSLIFPGKENIVRRVYYADKNIVYFGAKIYLDFIAENKIEGNYAYDPYDKEKRHRSEGKYNKDTRYLRNTLLMNLKNSMCKGFRFRRSKKYTKSVLLYRRSKRNY